MTSGYDIDRSLGFAELDGEVVPIADIDSLNGDLTEDFDDSLEVADNPSTEEPRADVVNNMGRTGLASSTEQDDEKKGCSCNCPSCDMGRHCGSESRGCYV